MSFVLSIKSSLMKNRFFFTPLILGLSVTVMLSCKTARERKSQNNDSTHPKAELVSSFEAYQNSASCTITQVTIDKNTITIDVEYSGGCEKHDFKLIGTEMIQKSMPPKRGVMLWHDSKEDSCRSIVTEQLKFDISVLAYEGGEIILNLDGWATPISYTKAN